MADHSQLIKKYAEVLKKMKELEEKIQFLNRTKEDKKKR